MSPSEGADGAVAWEAVFVSNLSNASCTFFAFDTPVPVKVQGIALAFIVKLSVDFVAF